MVPRRRARKKHNARLNARLTHARTPAAGLAWSAMCCTVWHGSITGAHRCTLIYLIIIGRLCWPVQRPAWRRYLVLARGLRLTVCPPAWHRWCIGGLCIFCIVRAGIWQIDGNAAVNTCKRLTRRLVKEKPRTLSGCKAKEKPGAWPGIYIRFRWL